jgi:hypothetical protein|tara:strand:- start:88 stop:258 length:171 start_codon:yes stop_codon:yes gene_type:complete
MPQSPFVYLSFQYDVFDAVYEELVVGTVLAEVSLVLRAHPGLWRVVLLSDLGEKAR